VRGGPWEQRPAEVRQRWIHNAPTFLDEERDPASREVDLTALRRFKQPTLLTAGDQSPPAFRVIVEMLARTLPQAQLRTIVGAGHGPHVTHPAAYAETIVSFIATVTAQAT